MSLPGLHAHLESGRGDRLPVRTKQYIQNLLKVALMSYNNPSAAFLKTYVLICVFSLPTLDVFSYSAEHGGTFWTRVVR